MLRETKGAWSVTCGRCRAVHEIAAAAFLEEAAAAAKAAGWLDQARRGVRLEKRAWFCPRCRPGDASGEMGRST